MKHRLFTAWLIAGSGIAASAALAGGIEQRAREVRAFIDSAVGGIATLQIPSDIQDLPQPLGKDGQIDSFYAITAPRAELGALLFHDPAFAAGTGFPETQLTASCASCHFVEAGFRAGQMQALGVGGRGFIDDQGRSRRLPIPSLWDIDEGVTPDFILDAVDNPALVSPSIMGVAYFDALLWNGSAVQSLPTELPPVERQVRIAFEKHRMNELAIREIEAYRPLFEVAFPEDTDLPDDLLMGLQNIIRAIAAYERTVLPDRSPWDAFLAGDDRALTFEQLDGAELFFGQANCMACHSGPVLGSTTFHALGVAEHPALPPGDENLGHYEVSGRESDRHAFRAMTVRHLKGSGPFFHGGSAQTLEAVVRYKNLAVPDQDMKSLSPAFVPLGLSESDIAALTAFLEDALYDTEMERFSPTAAPSGLCVPHDDQTSRFDAACDAYGDYDTDGLVDLLDFATLQLCYGSLDEDASDGCSLVDRDGDERIQELDYAAYHAALAAP